MTSPLMLAKTLRQYFLEKNGNNTISGDIYVDTPSVYDLGSIANPFHAVYADNIIGSGGGGGGIGTVMVQSGDTGDYLDNKIAVGSRLVKSITGTTNKVINLDVNTSTFLLRDGTNSLQGNLSVDSGITIDGVDLSVHVADPDAHHLRASGGTAITVAGQTISVKLSATPGLQIDGTDGGLKIGTPSSSGATSSNATTSTSHTHTITGYYNATAHFNELVKFGTSGEISPTYIITPLIITDTGQSIVIQPTDSIVLNPGNGNVILGYGQTFKSNGAISGFTGNGFILDSNVLDAGKATMNLDNLTVRGRLRVYELLIERIRATNGSVFVSSTGKIKTVTSLGGLNYLITTDPDHGFLENDVIRAQKWTGTEVYQSDLTVTTITDLKTFNATLRSGTTVPAVDMEFVRLGNTTDTTRQGALYLTADDSGAPFMDIVNGVTSHADFNTPGKVKVRLGRLTGVTGSSTEYGLIASNAGFGINDTYIRVSNIAFELHNTPIKLYNSSVQTVNISANGSDIWVGPSSSDKRISWNGSALSIIGSFNVLGNSSLDGVVTISSAGELRQGTGSFGSNFTGVRIWNDSNVGRIGGYQNNSLQWYGETDGTLQAGQGNIQLSYYGLDLVAYQGTAPNPSDNVKSISFWDDLASVDGINRPAARIWGAFNAASGQYGLQFEAFHSTLTTTYPKMWLVYDSITTQRNFTLTDLDLISLGGTSVFVLGTLTISGQTTINNHLVAGTASAYDIGTSGSHIRTLYVDTLVANSVTGGVALSGQVWEYDTGDMFIESNSASARTLHVTNPGAGLMHLDVEGDIAVGGTVDGTDIAAHVANINAHHNKAHVLATNLALGADHTVSGLSLGQVLRASGSTTAYFAQLAHSELGAIGANDHHNQSHLLANGVGLGADHTVSGLVAGNVLRALSATTASFSQVQFSEVGGTATDILSQYVHISVARTITARHTFTPATPLSPFILGANAQGQTVIGLKADQLNQSITAGTGLTGGGALTATVTIAVDTAAVFTWSNNHTWSSGTLNVATGNIQIAGTNVITSTRRIQAALGAIGTPSFTFSGDTNTGMYSSGADTLGFVTGGTEWMVLSSSGALTVSDNTDTLHKFGKAWIGYAGAANYAAFANRAMMNVTGFGLTQGVLGDTIVNAPSTAMVYIRSNNVDIAQFSATRINPSGSGLIALGDYNRKYSELNVRQLVVDNLVASNVMATIGGRIMVAPTAKLTRNVLSGDTTIYMDTNSFATSQVLYMAGFKAGVIQNERMRIINGPSTISATEWSYTVTRNIKDIGLIAFNGTFDTDVSGWISAGSSTITFAQDTDYFYGGHSLKATMPGLLGIPVLQNTIAIQPSKTYSVSFYAKTALSGLLTYDYLILDSVSAVLVGGPSNTIAASSSWYRYTYELTTGPTAAYIVLRFFGFPSAIYTGNFWLDEVIIEEKYATTSPAWYIGDAIVDQGYLSGSGFIDITSTITSMGHAGPTISTYARATTGGIPKLVVSSGNLRSLVDYTTDTYGIGIGNDLTLTPNGGFIGIVADAIYGVRLLNTAISLYQGGAEVLRINPTYGLRLTSGVATYNSIDWSINITDTPYASITSSGTLTSGYLSNQVTNGIFQTSILQEASQTLGFARITIQANPTSSVGNNGSFIQLYDNLINIQVKDILGSGTLAINGNLSVTNTLGAGWVAGTFNTNWANYGSPFPVFQSKRFGDMVIVTGLVKKTAATSSLIGQLSLSHRPATQKLKSSILHNGTAEVICRIDIDTAGQVFCQTNPVTVGYLSLEFTYMLN